MTQNPNPTAAFIVIGNEILSGRTQDKNINFVARELNVLGIRLMEVRVIPDVPETIIHTVNELRPRYTYVFTSGGIGPTHDDITTECIAEAFGVKAVRHPEAVRRLELHYQGKDIELNEARLRMAHIPEGASLIDNPVSAAPGFQIANVYVMAGVPSIMQAMMQFIKPHLITGAPIISDEIVVYIPEGTLAKDMGDVQKRYPEIDIGSYPFVTEEGVLGTSIVFRSTHVKKIQEAKAELERIIEGFSVKKNKEINY